MEVAVGFPGPLQVCHVARSGKPVERERGLRDRVGVPGDTAYGTGQPGFFVLKPESDGLALKDLGSTQDGQFILELFWKH